MLEIEHRDLDEAIARLIDLPNRDDLLLSRMKKRKLQLKDQILQLKMLLVPDIPAWRLIVFWATSLSPASMSASTMPSLLRCLMQTAN